MQRKAGSLSGLWHRHLQQSHPAEVKLGRFPSLICGAAARVVLFAHPMRRCTPPPRGRNGPWGEGEAVIFEVALAAREFALWNHHSICLSSCADTSFAWELSYSVLIWLLNAVQSRPQDRAVKPAKPLQTRERCVLRGRLKGKGFMGPGGFVVKGAKPSGWKLWAITVRSKKGA